jgi:hypothetical protein
MPAVAERLRRAYRAPLGRAGVGSIPAIPDALNVPSFRRWRFEMKLSPFLMSIRIPMVLVTDYSLVMRGFSTAPVSIVLYMDCTFLKKGIPIRIVYSEYSARYNMLYCIQHCIGYFLCLVSDTILARYNLT